MVIINNNNSRYPLDRRHVKRPLTLTPVRCPKPFAFSEIRRSDIFPLLPQPLDQRRWWRNEGRRGASCAGFIFVLFCVCSSQGGAYGERVCQLFFRIRIVFLVATVALARWVSVCAAACFYQCDGGTVMQVSQILLAADDPYPRYKGILI